MDFSQYTVVLSASGAVIVGGQSDSSQAQAQVQAEQATPAPSLFGGGGNFNLTQWILIYAVVIAAAYFVSAWPQRKKEKKLKELQDSIKLGDNVMTSGGFYGKVVDSGDGIYVVEFGTNKGVRIPVNKGDVFPVKAKGEKADGEKTES